MGLFDQQAQVYDLPKSTGSFWNVQIQGGNEYTVGLCHIRSHKFKVVGGIASAADDLKMALCVFIFK